MAIGVLISMAASPPVAERLGLDPFPLLQLPARSISCPAVVVLFVSLAARPADRRGRVSLVIFVVGLALMVAALMVGPEIKGAHRWIDFGPIDLQPSEFAKPAFVVIAAWFLAEGDQARRTCRGSSSPGSALPAPLPALLVMQPDFGQTALRQSRSSLTMLLIYGIPWTSLPGSAALAWRWRLPAYERSRMSPRASTGFLNPDKGDTFQVDTALQAFNNGGLLGTGPGGGEAKQILPDAHTDFTFAVVGEEFGFIACMVLLGLFAFVVMRVLQRAQLEADPFPALALSGLGTVFGLQAIINMGVNVSLSRPRA